MHHIHLLTAAMFAMVLGAHPAAGQGGDQPELFAVLDHADDEGEFLRITTVDGVATEGHIRDLDDRVIRLGGGLVELQTIERVETRIQRGRGSNRGAVIGAVVVGGAFGFVGLLVSTPLAPLIGAAAGGVVGAILGTAIGGAAEPGVTEWDVIWSR